MILPSTATLKGLTDLPFRASIEPIGASIAKGRYGYTDASTHCMYTRYSGLQPGQLIECDGDFYFVKYVATRKIQKEVLLDVINYESLSWQRFVEVGDGKGNIESTTWNEIGTPAAKVEFIRGNMHYNAGVLLSTTEIQITIQNAPVQIQDRFVVDGKNFKVDSIDTLNAPGLIGLQLSTDMR